MELSFVEEDDVMDTIDRLLQRVLALRGIELELPLERVPYDELMLRYGSDRPDRRLGLEIVDLTDSFRSSEFKVFSGAIEAGGGGGGPQAPRGLSPPPPPQPNRQG